MPRWQWVKLVFILGLAVSYLVGCGSHGYEANQLPSSPPVGTATPIVSPIPSPTVIESATPSPTNLPSPSPAITPSPTIEPAPSPSPTTTATPPPTPSEPPVILRVTTDHPEAEHFFYIVIVNGSEYEEYDPPITHVDDFHFNLPLERGYRYEIGFNGPISYYPIKPRLLDITNATPTEIDEVFNFVIQP